MTRAADPGEPSTTTVRSGDTVTVVPRGDLDVATAGAFADVAVAALGALPLRSVVVDLSGVDFVDSTGLGSLVRLRTEARRRGARMTVVGAPERVQRVLRITGLDRELGAR